MEIADAISAEKLLPEGRVMGLRPGHKVIDFGCGYGVGMDVREYVVWAIYVLRSLPTSREPQ